ncbi:putative dual-specificity kinase TKL-Pl-4 family [Helianthus annuus]|uniref:Dual-specificity kinase TKL-Pl-4 family n=1 Tax=Helianthus annuus TaxID=4232 RepID=A0A251S433_HELAN|nr:serine/threonine-protein kinase STY13 [Helianthus annuus]KAF5762690.1 putative dual-specificity kinase TKL-Pl-4 family [Helianthus annuus]KAJ0471413.1 putative dual-specificity kinase TKL-Pl-4 family [Helianthus annuus]
MSNSNSEKKNIIRTIEEGDFDNNNNNNYNNNNSSDGNNNNNSNNSNHKSGTVKSGSGCSKSVCSNGSITSSDCTIDERVLVDPKLLFIGAKIGEGAHGKVYEGKYGDRIVAIKVLNRGSKTEERVALESRFAREVTMMSRVKHENLVTFIGACKDPLMVIVSELLPGMSLRKYLGSIRPNQLDLRLALNFALDIARAMDCLHANGIIHRDLKPDNLLLTANQKSVKLADFGLAREETVTEMMTAETGTYRWMAPELYSTVTLRQGEKKHYNNKVDVYSFGIVLWELVTNRMPFEGMSNLQAAYAAAFKQERPNLSDDISPELAFIIQSCWVEDPNLRPSFDQIIRMLNTFLFTLPPPPPSSPPEECDASEDAAASNGGELSARSRRKFSFLRQIFAAKKTKNSQ